MKCLTLDWSNLHRHGDLWWRLLAHRHEVFVEKMGWDVPTANRAEYATAGSSAAESVEFDQYDSPLATYVIALDDDDEIVASARLIRTDVSYRYGPYDVTYMIKDASRGLLDNIPSDLVDGSCPADSATWEITRYTSLSRKASKAMAEALNSFLANMGARSMLSLSPSGFGRWFKAIGFEVSMIGPEHEIDGSAFGVFETMVRYDAAELEAPTPAVHPAAMQAGIDAAAARMAAE